MAHAFLHAIISIHISLPPHLKLSTQIQRICWSKSSNVFSFPSKVSEATEFQPISCCENFLTPREKTSSRVDGVRKLFESQAKVKVFYIKARRRKVFKFFGCWMKNFLLSRSFKFFSRNHAPKKTFPVKNFWPKEKVKISWMFCSFTVRKYLCWKLRQPRWNALEIKEGWGRKSQRNQIKIQVKLERGKNL